MFDLDIGKIIVVAAIALVVIGPRELPDVLRALAKAVAKLQRIRTQWEKAVVDFAKETDLDSATNDLRSIGDYSGARFAVNPATAMRGHLQAAPLGGDESTPSPSDPRRAESVWSSPEMKEYLAPELEPELLSIESAPREEGREVDLSAT